MREVARRYPDDADVQTMFAEAMMNTNPWKLWSADGTPAPGTAEIVATLEGVLAREPTHPGANHCYVHAIEASPHPEKAVASAERLEGMMPAAGHLEHMPAHIMQRVGRYEESAEANRKGAAADDAYFKLTAPPDYYPMYMIHNYQFLAASAAMEGRRAETIMAVRKARELATDQMLFGMPGYDWSVAFLYEGMVRFGLWDEILKEPAPNPKLPGLTIGYLGARATALAATGRLDEARSTIVALDAAVAATPADSAQGMNVAKLLFEIAALRAKARVALVERKPDEAIGYLRQAIAKEDALSYNEPADLFFPVRHLLGAVLIDAGKPAEAEAVYREDLKRNPANGWALFGLARALDAQRKCSEANAVRQQFAAAWSRADVQLASSAFWQTPSPACGRG